MSEVVKDESKDPNVQSRGISSILKPSITVFVPQKQNGIAALVVPGGGYTQNGSDKTPLSPIQKQELYDEYPADLHGGHGFAIRNAKGAVAAWPELCKAWMIEIGLFK